VHQRHSHQRHRRDAPHAPTALTTLALNAVEMGDAGAAAVAQCLRAGGGVHRLHAARSGTNELVEVATIQPMVWSILTNISTRIRFPLTKTKKLEADEFSHMQVLLNTP
jgi:hypothetical protein